MMKPEDSVVLASTTSKDTEHGAPSSAAPQVPPERKNSWAVKPNRRTPESMGLKIKAKRASHRRQIRRSHANG